MHSERLCFVVGAVGIVSLAGCGQIESTPDQPIGQGGADQPPSTSVVDPPAAKDAGVVKPRRLGSISMTTGGGVFYANAEFPFDVTAPPDGTPFAPCKLVPTPKFSGAGAPLPSDTAGDIVIDVPAKSGAKSSKLSFDPKQKSYQGTTLSGVNGEEIPTGGAPIHVHASGANVPAFDATLNAAFDTTIVEPAPGAVVSKTSGDLLLRWTDAGNDYVFASLNIVGSTISCSFPASAKQGVIPAALVKQALESTDVKGCAGKCANLFFWSLRSTRVTAGEIDVSLVHGVAAARDLQAE